MEDLKFQTAGQVMKHSNTDHNADFYTNMNKGFAMAINGFRISVQWGPGNYVDREIRYGNDYNAPMQHNIWGCDTAEVMIWDEKGRFAKHAGGPLFETAPWNDETDEYDFEWLCKFQFGHNDQVFGHCSSECVAKMIATLSSCGDEDPRNAIGQIYEFDIKKQ